MVPKIRAHRLQRTGAETKKTRSPRPTPDVNTRSAPLQLHEVIQRAQADAHALSPNDINVLQKTLGNGVVQRLLATSGQSAERTSRRSAAGPADPVQRQRDYDEEELLQGKFDPVQRQGDLDEEELMQGKFATGVPPTQFQTSDGPAENRTGMPDSLKSGLENLSDMDLSHVRVHYNSSEPAQVNALAYAQGQNIHVGPGQEKHLPHEGWHAVQQMQGRVKPTTQANGVAINDDPGLEREADLMGERALQRTAKGHSIQPEVDTTRS